MNDKTEKVYIVTSGAYSSYRIEACFTSRYRAKQYLEQYEKQNPSSLYGAQIETYELNTPNEWGYVTYVWMDYDGEVVNSYDVWQHMPAASFSWINSRAESMIEVGVVTRDERHAIKVANEKRAQILADPNKPKNRGKWSE